MRINYRPCRMNTIHKGYCYGHKNEKGKSLFKHTHECFKHVSAQAYQLHCIVFVNFLVREGLKYITKFLRHTKYSLHYISHKALIIYFQFEIHALDILLLLLCYENNISCGRPEKNEWICFGWKTLRWKAANGILGTVVFSLEVLSL